MLTRLFGDGMLSSAVALVLGALLLYTSGTLWYSQLFASGASVGAIISVTALPYLPFDALKIAFALVIGKRLKKYIK